MSDSFSTELASRLAKPLPGRAAHARFEPPLSFGRHHGPAPATARQAAVAILLYEHDGEFLVPLTLRPAHLATHGGQISFPGGLVERGESTDQAALRELEEELGVSPAAVTLLGELSPLYLYVSNFVISPHVACHAGRPRFRPSADEVEALLEVPIRSLLAEESATIIERHYRALSFKTPAMRLAGHEIWGATAMILAEFAAISP